MSAEAFAGVRVVVLAKAALLDELRRLVFDGPGQIDEAVPAQAAGDVPVRVDPARPAPEELRIEFGPALGGLQVQRFVERGGRNRIRGRVFLRVGDMPDQRLDHRARQLGQQDRHERRHRADVQPFLALTGEVEEESARLVVALVDERGRGLCGAGPHDLRAIGVARFFMKLRENALVLRIDRVDEDVLADETVGREHLVVIALHLRVGSHRALPGRGELVAGGIRNAEVPVVLGNVVEARFIGLKDGDESISIRVAHPVEPVVVATHLRQQFGEHLTAALSAADGEKRLGQKRRLDAVGKMRSPIRDRVLLQHLLEGLALPEGDVTDEAIIGLVPEQAADLGPGPAHVVAGEDDRVEAGIPEPLKRVGAGRWTHEVVVVAAPGGGSPLAIPLVKNPDPFRHGVIAFGVTHAGQIMSRAAERVTPGTGGRDRAKRRFRPQPPERISGLRLWSGSTLPEVRGASLRSSLEFPAANQVLTVG